MANKSISRIEGILQFYTTALGKHYNAYRNHVYRVYHLALILHKNSLSSLELEQLAIASAFHDLGIWTHDSMDYVDPSIHLAQDYMEQNEIPPHTVSLMISNHHKVRPYRGGSEQLVEAFRKADFIDLTLGIVSFGLPKRFYHDLVSEFPNLSFQSSIGRKGLLYALKHMLNPLPMLRW